MQSRSRTAQGIQKSMLDSKLYVRRRNTSNFIPIRLAIDNNAFCFQ